MTDAFGAVEAGGTNTVCVLGSDPDSILDRLEYPTTTPVATIDTAVGFFLDAVRAGRRIAALGLGWFGPLVLDESHPRFGTVGATPKTGWAGVDVRGPFANALGLPVALDTDVAAAALAEGKWGAAAGLSLHTYLTVGTGIGGGLVRHGAVLRGLGHPEIGHVPVDRIAGDDFAGLCPFHGDCLEGMAAGPAIAARWGKPAESLDAGEAADAVALVTAYVAQGLRAVTYTVAPERIVVGGGVARLPGFMGTLRMRLAESMADYPGWPEHLEDAFVSPAALGDMAGPLGGLILARRAFSSPDAPRSG